MSVSIVGIILCVVIVIVIIIVLIVALAHRSELNKCEANPNHLCYTIACPCDDPSQGPCHGFAKRPGPEDKPGTWYCSNTPVTLVNNDGGIIG